MKYIYSVLVLLLALFLAAFIQQNGSAIQLKYFYWSTPYLPLSLYMILSFAAGYALAVLVGFASGVRFRLRASGAEREVRQLRSEVEQLKKEEVKAVGEQYREEATEAPSGEGKLLSSGEGNADGAPGSDIDPDVPTVVTGRGEEEK